MRLHGHRVQCLVAALSCSLPPASVAHAAATVLGAPAGAARAVDQHFLVHSDTQYAWNDDGANPDPLAVLFSQSHAIKRWLSDRPADTPVFLNGDITAYGHGPEWKVMLNDLGDPALVNRYWGLGNHDYDQNIRQDGSGCANNGCARDSLENLRAAASRWNLDSFDYHVENQGLFRHHRGSLAYSKTIGDIKFIQLHNHYFYSVKFRSNVGLQDWRFDITPSLDWLEGELKRAKAAYKFVVINMHRPPLDYLGKSPEADAATQRFVSLVNAYRVLAIFHGHTHEVGARDPIGGTPVFDSGASFRKTFLTGEVDVLGNELRVYHATHNEVSSEPLSVEPLLKVFEPAVVFGTTPQGARTVSFQFGTSRRDLKVGWLSVDLNGVAKAWEGTPGAPITGLEAGKVHAYALSAYAEAGGPPLGRFTGMFTMPEAAEGPTNLCVLAIDATGGSPYLELQWDPPRTLPATSYSMVEGYRTDLGRHYVFRGANSGNQGTRRERIYYRREGIDDFTKLDYAVFYWSSSHGHTPKALLQGKDLFTSGCPAR